MTVNYKYLFLQNPETRTILPTEYLGVKLVSFGFARQGRAIMRGPMVSGVISQLLTTTEWFVLLVNKLQVWNNISKKAYLYCMSQTSTYPLYYSKFNYLIYFHHISTIFLK